MKWPFSYRDDFLGAALVLSLSLHTLILSLSHFLPSPARYYVQEAPTSIDIHIKFETIPLKPAEVIIPIVLSTTSLPSLPNQINEIKVKTFPITEATERAEQKQPVQIQSAKISVPIKSHQKIISSPQDPIQSQQSQGQIKKATPWPFQNPAPPYPGIARKNEWEGVVKLKVFVEKDGVPSQVLIEKSSGYRVLDESALKTVRDWQFVAAHAGSQEFSSWVLVPIRFRLIDEKN